jgi:hypothetical protein
LKLESDNQLPAKTPKAQMAGKATANTGMKVAGWPASDEEQPQEPKAKKVKLNVRDEINIAAKKIENKTEGMRSKYGDIIKSMSSRKTPSQAKAVGGRKGADIVDGQDVTPSTNRYRYILLTCTLMPPLLTLDQSTLFFYWTHSVMPRIKSEITPLQSRSGA